jgi:hypothetical protein
MDTHCRSGTEIAVSLLEQGSGVVPELVPGRRAPADAHHQQRIPEVLMKYVLSFIMKWIVIVAILLVVYSAVYAADVGRVLLMSVVFAIVSFLGDVFILPSVNNMTETVLDFIATFFLLWGFGAWLVPGQVPPVVAAILATIIIAFGEWFLHAYMKRNIYHHGVQTPSQA